MCVYVVAGVVGSQPQEVEIGFEHADFGGGVFEVHWLPQPLAGGEPALCVDTGDEQSAFRYRIVQVANDADQWLGKLASMCASSLGMV